LHSTIYQDYFLPFFGATSPEVAGTEEAFRVSFCEKRARAGVAVIVTTFDS